MYERFRAVDLTTVLRELDISKALMRQKQVELNNVVRLLPANYSSQDLRMFEAKSHAMNVATERYLRAVEAFNAACQEHRNPRRGNSRFRKRLRLHVLGS